MVIRGIAHWAKIVGKPQWGYKKQHKEWSFDLALDAETAKKLRKEGFSSQIKNKGDDRGDFISFKRKELKKDGTAAKPFRIVDHKGNEWGNELVGNGSTLNVKLAINEWEDGTKKLSAVAIQVWDLVKYEGKGGSGGGDDDFPVKAATEEEEWA